MTSENLTTSTQSDLYLDLLKMCLTRLIFVDHMGVPRRKPRLQRIDEDIVLSPWTKFSNALARRFAPYARLRHLKWTFQYQRRTTWSIAERLDGRDWPKDGETMIGLARLDSLQSCVESVLREDVPGDLIETGVWRGGASILMRAILKVNGDVDRSVWLADSFAGLPKPDKKNAAADDGDLHWVYKQLVVSLDQVKANFARYGLLDERVRFIVGWFSETLPVAPIKSLSLMRLDGDMYSSTMVALTSLYGKLSSGGYCIIDDYGAVPGCRKAVDEFRASIGETADITVIDWSGIYWRKSSPAIRA